MSYHLNFNTLDQYLEKAHYYYDLPGLAVSVTQGDSVYQRALGYQNAITKTPLKISHVFHMASVTKLFIGTGILKLSEIGHLHLDEPLTNYLPWFQMADPRYLSITIRQLLSHTSGMPDVLDYHWETPETDEGALKRYVQSPEVQKAHLLWDPKDGRFAYSSMGYEILGVVISTLTGESVEDWISNQIFEPLGMSHSTLLTFRRSMEDVCSPHIKTVEKETVLAAHFPYNRAHGPSSTLTSNLEDMAKWARANLIQSAFLLETYEEAWSKQAFVPNNGEHICLSWFCREQKGYELYGHEGTDEGFRASFWICPELDLSITVCSNLSGAPVKKINKQLFELLVDEKAEQS